jgi:hypothetical protein
MGHLPINIAQDNNLYWCSADDHWEDWFVIARTKARAKQIFADYNGYLRNETEAVLVAKPSTALLGKYDFTEGLADQKDIEAYGGKVLLDRGPMVVAFGDRMFREGSFEGVPGMPVNTSEEPWTMAQVREVMEKAFPAPSTKPKDKGASHSS